MQHIQVNALLHRQLHQLYIYDSLDAEFLLEVEKLSYLEVILDFAAIIAEESIHVQVIFFEASEWHLSLHDTLFKQLLL